MFNEPPVSDSVSRVCSMLAAIDLDDESSLSANKVDDVGANWFLAHEFEAAEPARPEVPPQSPFCEGRFFS